MQQEPFASEEGQPGRPAAKVFKRDPAGVEIVWMPQTRGRHRRIHKYSSALRDTVLVAFMLAFGGAFALALYFLSLNK